MNHPRLRIVRCCPKCKNLDVRRSHRKGFLETFILPLLLLRPYRCNECQLRHINTVFARKVSIAANQIQDAE
jgi:hypothetical protein